MLLCMHVSIWTLLKQDEDGIFCIPMYNFISSWKDILAVTITSFFYMDNPEIIVILKNYCIW